MNELTKKSEIWHNLPNMHACSLLNSVWYYRYAQNTRDKYALANSWTTPSFSCQCLRSSGNNWTLCLIIVCSCRHKEGSIIVWKSFYKKKINSILSFKKEISNECNHQYIPTEFIYIFKAEKALPTSVNLYLVSIMHSGQWFIHSN